MASQRTKSIGTKVTDEEYARLEALAGEQTISEWARAVLLKAAAPSAEPVLLAELLALRAILLNLHFAVCTGEARAAALATLLERLAEGESSPVFAKSGPFILRLCEMLPARQARHLWRARDLLRLRRQL